MSHVKRPYEYGKLARERGWDRDPWKDPGFFLSVWMEGGNPNKTKNIEEWNNGFDGLPAPEGGSDD